MKRPARCDDYTGMRRGGFCFYLASTTCVMHMPNAAWDICKYIYTTHDLCKWLSKCMQTQRLLMWMWLKIDTSAIDAVFKLTIWMHTIIAVLMYAKSIKNQIKFNFVFITTVSMISKTNMSQRIQILVFEVCVWSGKYFFIKPSQKIKIRSIYISLCLLTS